MSKLPQQFSISHEPQVSFLYALAPLMGVAVFVFVILTLSLDERQVSQGH
jgi:hypothetical protein